MRRRAGVAVGLVCALALAACSGGAADPPGDGPSAPTSSAGATSTEPAADPSVGPAPADPAHAVDAPGPRKGRLVPPDLLVFSKEPLSDELVEQVDGLRRVDRTERLSLANVGIENRVVTVAAVDPGSYRNYTLRESAELQEQWERVAGGEIAVTKQLGRKLQREQGEESGGDYLKLGNDDDAPSVHIGAYAPQVPQIDLVVNERWGEELGMPLGNALIVTTGLHSPREVVKEVQRVVGDQASVTILGPDLDPGARQTAVLTGGSVADAVGTFRYTVLGGGRIGPEQSWVAANIRTEPVPILGNVTCHRVMLPQLRAALLEVQTTGLADEINPGEYAGCYYPRFIAGSQQLSLHSFGIAVDLNVPGNQRGTAGEISRAVVAIFKKWGFAWGGDWAWTDPMHFEMDRIVEVR